MNLYIDHTDSQLFSALREGQTGAFREIYSRYAQNLFNYATTRIRNREDCKELVQDVFEGLWKTDTQIRGLRPFLFTMMKYSIINYYEKKGVRQKFSEYIARFKDDLSVTDEPEEEIQNLRKLINASLKKLPQRCQDAVRMRIDEELSLDEIAMRMEVDKGSVKRYLTMAMNALRKEHKPIYKSS